MSNTKIQVSPEDITRGAKPFDFFRVYTSGSTAIALSLLKKNHSIFFTGLYHEICNFLFANGLYAITVSEVASRHSYLRHISSFVGLSPKKFIKSVKILVEYDLFDRESFETYSILQSEDIFSIYSILSKRRVEYYTSRHRSGEAVVIADVPPSSSSANTPLPLAERLANWGIGKNNIDLILKKRTSHFIRETLDDCFIKIAAGDIKNPAGYIVNALLKSPEETK